MKHLSRISIFFFLLLAIGCNSQTETPTSLPVTATIENTETPKPTSTPTTSLSPTPDQITIEFPEWVKNPETQILLMPVIEFEANQFHYKGLFLFNAETGEKYKIPYTNQKGDYFWMPDGSGFGFLPKKKEEFIFFSIQEEEVFTISIQKSAFRFINRDDSVSQPIQISSSDFDNPNFLFLYDWELLSPDRRYFIYYGDSYDVKSTDVMDISSGELIKVSDPDDEYNDLYKRWSPSSNLLAIAEADQSPQLFNSFDVFPNFRLRVYDVETRKIIASYKNVTFPKWSPDGTKFLFQELKGTESYWYGGSPPCIYDTLLGTTNCFNQLIINDKITITSAEWSPDQSMIGFVYLDFEPKVFNETGSFCTLQISTENTACILKKLDSDGQKVVDYLWSPDSNYISFFYDTSYPFSDYRIYPQIGIANIRTGEYFHTSIPVSDTQWLGLWRPSPNP
jgi:Tol biopolymer transport system component